MHACKFKTKEKGLVFELNGEHYWDTDNIRLDLEAGDHTLRVFKASELIDEQNIKIDKPETFNYKEKRYFRISSISPHQWIINRNHTINYKLYCNYHKN